MVHSSGARAAACITGRQLVHPSGPYVSPTPLAQNVPFVLTNLPDLAESFSNLKLIGYAVRHSRGWVAVSSIRIPNRHRTSFIASPFAELDLQCSPTVNPKIARAFPNLGQENPECDY